MEATFLIRDHRGGLGSRLHGDSSGWIVAYAQWPNVAAWESSGNIPLPANTALERMKDAIEASEPPIKLQVLEDLLVHTKK